MRITGDNIPTEELYDLERSVFDTAHIRYGCTVSGNEPLMHEATPYARLEKEWKHILSMNDGVGWRTVLLLKKVTDWLKQRQNPYWMSTTAGNSFVLYLLGITEGNPLPPHRYIHGRRGLVWSMEKADGFDLDKTIAFSRTLTGSDWNIWASTAGGAGDGHHLPYEITDWKDLCIRCSPDCETELRKEFAGFGIVEDKDWLKKRHGIRNGYPEGNDRLHAVITIAFSDDIPAKDGYFYDTKVTAKNWRQILADSGLSNEAFLDRCFHLRDRNVTLEKTGGNKHYLEDMQELTGYFSEDTLFADMVTFGGLCVNGIWNDTAKTLVKELGYPVHGMIAFRDDVYDWLLSSKALRYGVMSSFAIPDAYGISVLCHTCEEKDKGLRKAVTSVSDGDYAMLPYMGLEPWILRQIRGFRYLFPKAHAVERILFELRLLASGQMKYNVNKVPEGEKYNDRL